MNEETSIVEIAKLIASLLNTDIKIIEDDSRIRPSNSEVDRLRCNNTRIKEHIQWAPQYSLEQGLKETIQWYEEHFDLYKAEIYNV